MKKTFNILQFELVMRSKACKQQKLALRELTVNLAFFQNFIQQITNQNRPY